MFIPIIQESHHLNWLTVGIIGPFRFAASIWRPTRNAPKVPSGTDKGLHRTPISTWNFVNACFSTIKYALIAPLRVSHFLFWHYRHISWHAHCLPRHCSRSKTLSLLLCKLNGKSRSITGNSNQRAYWKADGATELQDGRCVCKNERVRSAASLILREITHEGFGAGYWATGVAGEILATEFPTTEEGILRVLEGAYANKPAGPDGIHSAIVKPAERVMWKCIPRKIEGFFLDRKVRPAASVQKCGSGAQAHNYRLVSLACIFCNGLEKLTETNMQ